MSFNRKSMGYRTLMPALAALLALAGCSNGGGSSADGESYPDETVTFISPTQGGGLDLAVNSMQEVLKGTGIVDAPMRLDHRVGGASLVAVATLGGEFKGQDSTLLLVSPTAMSSTIVENPAVGIQDLTPIARVFAEHTYFYVPADSQFQSLDDVAAALENDSKDVKIGGADVGSTDTIVLANWVRQFDLTFADLTYLPLGATGETTTNLLGGHIDLMIAGADQLNLVESGDARAIAMSADERLEGSDVPTFVEQGYDVRQSNYRGLFGPPDMPQYAVDYWTAAIDELVETAEWKDIASSNNWDTDALVGDEFGDYLAEQQEPWAQALRDLGLVE